MAGRKRRLTDAGVAKLAPATREYTVWDTRHAGLGVRVRPTGHRSFVYQCWDGQSSRRQSIGSAALTTVNEARSKCRALDIEAASGGLERKPVPTFAEFVDGAGRVCLDRCKPSARKRMRQTLNGRLLPAFGSVRLDRITRIAVNAWFGGYSRNAPGGANRTLELLRWLLNHAVDCGIIKSNPAPGIRLNPLLKRTRFLSREEIARLRAAPDTCDNARPSVQQQADIIRLLLFTGCRRSEIVTLRWQDIGADALRLADAKTGPRTVPLNAPARAVLQRQTQAESNFVFPSPKDRSLPRSGEIRQGYAVRKEAGIEDVRLHDLRPSYASQAVMQGIPLPVVSRLLGPRNPRMTLRYAHVGNQFLSLRVRPIHHRIADRVRAHFLLCMLAYYVEWHMRDAWSELLFADPAREKTARTRDPVAPAERGEDAERKVTTACLDDGSPVYCFRTLIGHLQSINRHTCRPKSSKHGTSRPSSETFELTTNPTQEQQKALDMLKAIRTG